jgi:2-methylcitrate dehydratase PrpD
MALKPVEQYNLGFHPSAVCGAFGSAAASARLLKLSPEATERALGLASCQASGMMAWETDPTENARPFQMGIAARNGVTAALLAAADFGAPTGIFDRGHTVFRAFSRAPSPDSLVRGLGHDWSGVEELAIKPYPCVAFLHPALDALFEIVRAGGVTADDVDTITMRFAQAGAHCIDGNPLKSHCAQYVLPTALVRGKLEVADIFIDRRETDPLIRQLSGRVSVVVDSELEKIFPDFYATILEVRLKDGRKIIRRKDIARGYPEAPMSLEEINNKFFGLLEGTMPSERAEAIAAAVAELPKANRIDQLASLLGAPMGVV